MSAVEAQATQARGCGTASPSSSPPGNSVEGAGDAAKRRESYGGSRNRRAHKCAHTQPVVLSSSGVPGPPAYSQDALLAHGLPSTQCDAHDANKHEHQLRRQHQRQQVHIPCHD